MKKNVFKKILGVIMSITLASSLIPFNVMADSNENVSDATIPYLNIALSFEERAADLVSRLTLEEKVSQTVNSAAAIPRLGISGYNYWREALHGVARQGKATSFPSSLSMSNSWNRDLIYEAADITSTEARGKNANTNLSYWSPTINMARDPRWGRNEETYGEDPYLTSELASEFVRGMQGNDDKYLKTISTVKHFVANNCENERRGGSSVMDERTMREYYAKVFQNVVEKANPASAMSSYNATTVTRNGETLYDYIPSAANEYTLTELLRRNWGFDGYVTGDCGAVQDVGGTSVGGKTDAYKKALFPELDVNEISAPMAIAESFKAGNDIDCGSVGSSNSYNAVIDGYMTESQLDVNLYRLFLQRMKTGEFDEGSTYSDIKSDVIEKQEHIDVAEKAAEETWVLLKNDNNILPLSSEKKNIVIVGNLAGENILGDYSGEPEYRVTPFEGLKSEIAKINPDAKINYLAHVEDNDTLFNIKSLTFVLEDGKTRKIDISKAQDVKGMTLENGSLNSVTRNGSAIIKNVDFSKVVSVKAEVAAGNTPGGSIVIKYGSGGPSVATINSQKTADLNTYVECTTQYLGGTGGYVNTADLQIQINPNEEFSLEKYKEELDLADVIIAYTGTSEADSSEGSDRSSISLPSSQYHVKQITDNYPDKTIVAIQSVGQIDVAPFADNSKAILWTSYNGQTQGTAFAKIIMGEVNPSGKLTTTWYPVSDLQKMPINTQSSTVDGIRYYRNDYSIRSTDNFPGRTYQYYNGKPIYPFGYGLSYTNFEYSNINISSNSVDANGKITVTADIKNSGNVDGKEIVQLYISFPGSDGKNLPVKQLKGFTKEDIKAGETKKVSFELFIKDFNFFDEVNQKIYVPTGEYTVTIAKNSNDPNALAAKFNVSGQLQSIVKTVKAIPNGIKVVGVYTDGDNASIPNTTIDPNVSCVMTDEIIYDMSKANVSYSSSDTDVAFVDADGIVKPGTKSGVAIITVSVTADGTSGTDSFPVVCEIYERVTDEIRANYLSKLEDEYKFCPETAYSPTNYEIIKNIYNEAKTSIENVLDLPNLNLIYQNAINDLRAVEQDMLKDIYKLESDFIKDGKIEYDGAKIPMYDASETSISGTITSETSLSGININASKNGVPIDPSKLKWKIEKLDDSKREPAEIDYLTGELTIKENGLVKITAVNVDELECGTAIILINIQVEGEDADEGNGANLLDNKSGASGPSDGPNNAGSTNAYWLEFKGIRLESLSKILLRTASKSDPANIKISLDKNENVSNIIASGTIQPTGAWNKWQENTFDVNQDVIESANVDENGLTTIYIKTNKANLDFFRLIYADEGSYPYTIKGAQTDSNGSIKVSLTHKLNSENGILIGAVYDENNKMQKMAKTAVSNTGEYSINGEFEAGEKVNLFVWDDLDNMNPISEISSIDYKESELIVYSFTDPSYDSWYGKKGDPDGNALLEVNGLSGYGLWERQNTNVSFEYNGKTYNFTRGLKGGSGSETKKCAYFVPKGECTVTVLFDGTGQADREMKIVQNKNTLASAKSELNKQTSFNCKITDTSSPVYIMGGGQNKALYAIFVEYK